MELAKEKNRAFFVPFIFSKGNFFNICVFSHCIVYWIHLQNIHTFTFQKTLFNTFFCLFLKSPKTFSVSLSKKNNINIACWQSICTNVHSIKFACTTFNTPEYSPSLYVRIRSERPSKYGYIWTEYEGYTNVECCRLRKLSSRDRS